jgi:hypothetical protein
MMPPRARLIRLASVCEMMRSDYEPERATAARIATRMVHELPGTWTGLITAVPAPADDTIRRAKYAIQLCRLGRITEGQCLRQITAVLEGRY